MVYKSMYWVCQSEQYKLNKTWKFHINLLSLFVFFFPNCCLVKYPISLKFQNSDFFSPTTTIIKLSFVTKSIKPKTKLANKV